MKSIIEILIPAVLTLSLTSSCGLDNYDAPQGELRGKITYKGEPLGLKGTGEAVQLQLYQDGYALKGSIPVYVGQEGEFRALLFDGTYKLVTRDHNGPWVNSRDTITFRVNGGATVEVPVTPFFTLSDTHITLNGTTLNGTVRVNRVVPNARIDYLTLVISKTSFVDETSNIARVDLRDIDEGTHTLKLDLKDNSDFSAARKLYARIGVRALGADQCLYSPVISIR